MPKPRNSFPVDPLLDGWRRRDLSKADCPVVLAAQAGSREAFEILFQRHKFQIYNYILRLMGRVEDAHDLTQDTFLKAFVALPKARGEMNFVPWLYRIATNVCRDELRRRKIIKWQSLGAAVAGFLSRTIAPDDPEDECVRRESAARVQLVLSKIREKYRLCLVMRECEDLSCEEIGQVLGISRQAAKSLLFRAREEFRTIYCSLEPGDGGVQRAGLRLSRGWQP